MALSFPPIPAAFLAMFRGDGSDVSVIWENASSGLFGVMVRANGGAVPADFTIPTHPPDLPPFEDVVVEVATEMTLPTVPPGTDPPICQHGRPAVRRTVMKRGSPNIGRLFYVCSWNDARRCGFFRWGDELDQFSATAIGTPLSATDVQRETKTVDPDLQLAAWKGVQQGTPEWHRLRACRLTAPSHLFSDQTKKMAGRIQLREHPPDQLVLSSRGVPPVHPVAHEF